MIVRRSLQMRAGGGSMSAVAPTQLIEANSKLSASESVGESIAPGLGGLLVQLLGAPFAVLDADHLRRQVHVLHPEPRAGGVRPSAGDRIDQRRIAAVETCLRRKAESLNLRMAKLDAMSPLAVLTRGYSITQTADGTVLRDPSDVRPGDKLKIRLERGKLDAEVLAS